MIKNLLNQEKGIALTVAVLVMIVLLGLAGAMFISTQSEQSKSMLSKNTAGSLIIANAGAERALWYIQQKLDNNTPNWPTDGENLFKEEKSTINYNDLCKEKDPDKYKNYGISLDPSTKYSYLYASKMVHEHDNEWAVYTAGVMRTPSGINSNLSSGKITSATKITIRLGTGTPPNIPDITILSQNNDAESQRLLENANLNVGGPKDSNGNPKAKIVVTNELWQNQGNNTTVQFYKPGVQGKDGIDANSYVQSNEYIKDKNGNVINKPGLTYNSMEVPPFPMFDFSKLAQKADYNVASSSTFVKINDGGGKYHYEVDNKSGSYWYHVGIFSGTVGPTVDQMKSAGSCEKTSFYDKNGDGFVTIYVPPDGGLRIQDWTTNDLSHPGFPMIHVMPGARTVIVSEGQGKSADGVDGMGVEIRTVVQTINWPESAGTSQGGGTIDFMWENGIPGSNPVFIYDNSDGSPYRPNYLKEGSQITVNPVVDVPSSDPSYPPIGRTMHALTDNTLGTFDIISKYDVIFSNSDIAQTEATYQDRFRGYVYSENKIRLQKDVFIWGSMMANSGVVWTDAGLRTHSPYRQSGDYYLYRGDGYDTSMFHENPLERGQTESNFYRSMLKPTQGGGGGRLTIVAWENISSNQFHHTY